jgi:hypothetical protein
LPTSIRLRRRWRVFLAAKNRIDRGRRRYASLIVGDGRHRSRESR